MKYFLTVALFVGSFLLTVLPAQAAVNCTCLCQLRDGRTESLPIEASAEDQAGTACLGACTERFDVADIINTSIESGSCVTPTGSDAVPATPTNTNGIPALENPLGTTSVPQLLGRVINAFLGITGSLALLLFIYGGFLWLTSGGNEDSIKKGKATIVWAVLGLVIIFGAYALVNFVISRALGLQT